MLQIALGCVCHSPHPRLAAPSFHQGWQMPALPRGCHQADGSHQEPCGCTLRSSRQSCLGKEPPGKRSQQPADDLHTHTHTHQELRNRVTVTTATDLAGEHNAQKEGRRRARRPRRLLLALLLLLVPPEVGLDGQSRLLGGIAEEFALTAGIRGHIAYGEKQRAL